MNVWKSVSGADLLDVASGTIGYKHEGGKAMSMKYTFNSTGIDSVYREFSPVQNWSFANTNAKTLAIYLRGTGNNMSLASVGLQLRDSSNHDSTTIFYPTPDDIVRGESWVQWNVSTDSFAAAGFSINSVKRVSILLDSGAISTANRGTIYLDDVRLYPSRCVNQTNDIGIADITNDCSVDNDDLLVITNDWLKADSQAIPNGILHNFSTGLNGDSGWQSSNCKFGNCLKFDGTDDWVDIDDKALPQFSNKTISFWVRRDSPAPDPVREMYIVGASNDWRVNIAMDTSSTTQVLARVGGGLKMDFGKADLPADTWTHVALVIKVPSGDLGKFLDVCRRFIYRKLRYVTCSLL